MNRISGLVATAVVLGAVGLAGAGADSAFAEPGGYTWCPGQPLPITAWVGT
jgi:hypothetical protein